jgi:hypothetical protein
VEKEEMMGLKWAVRLDEREAGKLAQANVGRR